MVCPLEKVKSRFLAAYKGKHENNIPHGNESIRALAEFKKRTLILYNNDYQVIDRFDYAPKDNRTQKRPDFELQITAANHFIALLPKSHQPEWMQSHLCFGTKNQTKDTKEETNEDTCKRILKFENVNTLSEKFETFDIESAPDPKDNTQKPYAIGNSHITDDGLKYTSFWGLDCISKWFGYLSENIDRVANKTLYAHNGGKFDVLILIREYLLNNTTDWRIRGDKSKCVNGRWLQLVLEHKSGKFVSLGDTVGFFNTSLDSLLKEYQVEHQKLTETVSHDEITLENFQSYHQLPKYLEHDCIGLLEALRIFNKDVWDLTYSKKKEVKKIKNKYVVTDREIGGINMTSCISIASIAKKHFFRSYYGRNIYTLSKSVDQFIRRAYSGGRTESFVRPSTQIKEALYYLDFTSLYPAVARNLLPIGEPEFRDLKTKTVDDLIQDGWFGFVRCMVKSTQDSITTKRKPIHERKDDNTYRSMYNYYTTFTEMTLFSEELKRGYKENMYEYILIDGYEFGASPVMEKFMSDGFQNKARYKAEGKTSLSNAYKVMINSGYGFWALRTTDRESVVINTHDRVDIASYVMNDQLLDFVEYEKYTCARVAVDINVTDVNIGVAAAITSYARMHLWKLIDRIEQTTDSKVYYCDTDSVITNCNINDHPDLMKEFCPDGTGEALGSLKNECTDKLTKHFDKKIRKKYNLQAFDPLNETQKTEKKDLIKAESHTFDSLIVAGLKKYSLQKILTTGDEILCNAMNGGSPDAMSHQDYLGYIKDSTDHGFTITKQQFITGGLTGMVSKNPFRVEVQENIKNIRHVYNKAQWNDDSMFVTPFVV